MKVQSAAAAAVRLRQLGVPMHGAAPAPGLHRMAWNDFVEAFGYTPERQAMISDLHVGVDAARGNGARKAWVGGSLTRIDKDVPGDADFVIDSFNFEGINDAVIAAHAVGGDTRTLTPRVRELLDERINVFPEHAEMLDSEWLRFLQIDDRQGIERGVIELWLPDVPPVNPASFPHTHAI